MNLNQSKRAKRRHDAITSGSILATGWALFTSYLHYLSIYLIVSVRVEKSRAENRKQSESRPDFTNLVVAIVIMH